MIWIFWDQCWQLLRLSAFILFLHFMWSLVLSKASQCFIIKWGSLNRKNHWRGSFFFGTNNKGTDVKVADKTSCTKGFCIHLCIIEFCIWHCSWMAINWYLCAICYFVFVPSAGTIGQKQWFVSTAVFWYSLETWYSRKDSSECQSLTKCSDAFK